MNEGQVLTLVREPTPQWETEILDGAIHLYVAKRPNIWKRFWLFVLFGVRFTRIRPGS